MNKASAFGVLVALVACAGVAFSVVEMKKMSGTLAALDERLAKVEAVTAAPAASGGSASPVAAAPVTMADVAQEIAKLKAEVAEVRTGQDTLVAAAAAGKDEKETKVARVSGDEVELAVDKVLAKKEEERKERDAKRQQEWQARAAQGMVDNLAKELGLTEQQKTQITEIANAQMIAFRDAMSNRKEGEDVMAKMTTLRTDTDTKIKTVLTPEQGVKYDELAKNPMQLWGGGMGGFGGRQRGGGGSTEGNER